MNFWTYQHFYIASSIVLCGNPSILTSDVRTADTSPAALSAEDMHSDLSSPKGLAPSLTSTERAPDHRGPDGNASVEMESTVLESQPQSPRLEVSHPMDC